MNYRDHVVTEREQIYNDMCSALTDFETDVFQNKKFETINYHIGTFYGILTTIQNNWEGVITAQVD